MDITQLLLVCIYGIVATYSIFGGWRASPERIQIRLISLLILPAGIFIVYWLAGRGIWGVVWSIRYMDRLDVNDHDIDYLRNVSAGICVVVVSAIILARISIGFVTWRYTTLLTFGTVILAVVFAICALQFAHS